MTAKFWWALWVAALAIFTLTAAAVAYGPELPVVQQYMSD